MKKTTLLLMRKTTLLLTVVATFFAVGAATPAFAADPDPDISPMGACGYNDYNYVNRSYGYVFTRASGSRSAVSGDPGVTLTISTSTAFTVTGTIGSNTQISVSMVILTVQQSLNVSITAGFTRTTTNSGAWTVPASYTNGGMLEIGARKYSGTVSKYRAKVSDCTNGAFISSVNYNAPQDGWYFKTTRL